MGLHPRVVQRRVIRDEVEHEPEATRPESVAEASQSRIAAQARVHGVAGDGEPGADDVLLAQVRQGLLELAAPFRVTAGNALPGQAGLPDAQEPDPVEAHFRQAVQFRVRDVVQDRGPTQLLGKLRQPDAGVDLVQRRITRCWHSAQVPVRMHHRPKTASGSRLIRVALASTSQNTSGPTCRSSSPHTCGRL